MIRPVKAGIQLVVIPVESGGASAEQQQLPLWKTSVTRVSGLLKVG